MTFLTRACALRTVLLAVAASALVLAACGGDDEADPPESTPGQVTTIDSAEGKALIDSEDVLVIDVRTVEEYTEGHLVGAQNISIEDDELWAARTAALDPEQPMVVYCRTGRRSSEAAQRLVDAGFVSIYDLGGVEEWDPEQLKVES